MEMTGTGNKIRRNSREVEGEVGEDKATRALEVGSPGKQRVKVVVRSGGDELCVEMEKLDDKFMELGQGGELEAKIKYWIGRCNEFRTKLETKHREVSVSLELMECMGLFLKAGEGVEDKKKAICVKSIGTGQTWLGRRADALDTDCQVYNGLHKELVEKGTMVEESKVQEALLKGRIAELTVIMEDIRSVMFVYNFDRGFYREGNDIVLKISNIMENYGKQETQCLLSKEIGGILRYYWEWYNYGLVEAKDLIDVWVLCEHMVLMHCPEKDKDEIIKFIMGDKGFGAKEVFEVKTGKERNAITTTLFNVCVFDLISSLKLQIDDDKIYLPGELWEAMRRLDERIKWWKNEVKGTGYDLLIPNKDRLEKFGTCIKRCLIEFLKENEGKVVDGRKPKPQYVTDDDRGKSKKQEQGIEEDSYEEDVMLRQARYKDEEEEEEDGYRRETRRYRY